MIFEVGIKNPYILTGIFKPFKILRKYRLNDFSKPNDTALIFSKKHHFTIFKQVLSNIQTLEY
jgi:hypothetical protein